MAYALAMNADAAIEAIKAIHVPQRFSFNRDNFASPTGQQNYSVTGCRTCGGKTVAETMWPCPTRALVDLVAVSTAV